MDRRLPGQALKCPAYLEDPRSTEEENSASLSVRPSARLVVRPSGRPFVLPSVRPFVRLSVRPSVCPSVRPSVRPPGRPSVRPSVHPILGPLVREKHVYRLDSESTPGSYHQGTTVHLGVLLRRPAWALRFLTGLLPSILRRVQTLRLCKGTATVWMNLFRYAAVGLQQLWVRRFT